MSAQQEQSMPGPKSKQTRRLRSASGVRPRRLAGSRDWQRQLVEHAASASGATRVLLLRERANGPLIVASYLPPDDDAATLHGAIGPWLDEARRTRHARLRHGPAGAAVAEQRSCIVVPLVGDAVLGFLYADIDGAAGRFRSRRPRSARRPRRCRRGRARSRGRRREPGARARRAIGRARAAHRRARRDRQHPAGMAAALGFQAIVDLVGDKLREVFATGDIASAGATRRQAGAVSSTATSTACGSPAVGAGLARSPGRQRCCCSASRCCREQSGRERAAVGLFQFAGTDPSLSSCSCRCSRSIASSARSSSRTTSASTPSARPTSASLRPSPPAWALRSRTRACSTRRSGC